MTLKHHKLSVAAMLGLSVALSPVASQAAEATNIGYGQAGGAHSVFSTMENALNNQSALTNSAFGLGAAFTVTGEAKGLENIFDRFKIDIQDEVDALTITQIAADAFVNAFNDGSIAVSADASIPLLVKTNNFGNISVIMSRSMGASAKTFQHTVNDGLPATVDVQLGMDVVAAEKTEVALGYSKKLNALDATKVFGKDSMVSYGVKARLVSVGANKSITNFDNIKTGATNSETYIEDQLKAIDGKVATSEHFTADFGLRVSAENWNAGATVKNIMPITVDYTIDPANTDATQLAGQFDASFEMGAFAVVDATYHSADKNWAISAYAETNEHKSYLNQSVQNSGIHASYATDTAYIPDLRLGFDQNLVGTQFSKYSAGLTVGFVNIDVAASSMSFAADKQEDFAGSVSLSMEAEF